MIVKAKPTVLPVHTNVTRGLGDNSRGQLGMSTRLLEGVDYDRLVMSLQSPLPNDQDMAISVCTLLSNETKHVLKFSRAPRILDLLLAHAGIFNHCKLREVIEISYWEARKLCHNTFWMENIPEGVARHPLCECFVPKVNYSIGIEEEYSDYFQSDSVEEPDLTDEDRWILMNRKRISESELEKFSPSLCCARCPCKGIKSRDPLDPFPALNSEPQPMYLLRTTVYSDDRIGQRITQISNILRNLSFEEDNALVMASNPGLLRFVLISSECSWGQIPQLALDLLGNIAHHLQLKEPSMDPLSCRILSLIVGGLFSSDRFRVLRSLECLREVCKKEGNDEILHQYVKLNVYKRICELLTISDIMLLIYTLECLLSMTGLGEAVCNELSRVQGSVASLVSLVTVEAQSYGPKGCILMRVVETVTGSLQPQQGTAQGNPAASTGPSNVAATVGATSGTSPVQIPRTTYAVQQQHFQPGSPAAGRVSLASVGSLSISNNLGTLQAAPHQFSSANSPQAVISSNTPARVPSPALSPSLSLSPVPSPAPMIHSASSPQGHNQYHQQVNASSGGYSNVGPLRTSLNSPPLAGVGCSGGANSVSVHQDSHGRNTGSVPTVVSSDASCAPVSISSLLQNSNAGTVVPSQSVTGDSVVSTISLPLVTPKGTLSEEGWAIAWLKGAFEVFPGTSIEQGESYRMYTVARKNPQKTLSVDQFVQCVKCAYGTSVGPVIKQFGSNSLSFFEGIRPKISVKPSANTPANHSASATTVSVMGQPVQIQSSAISSLPSNTTSQASGQMTTPASPTSASVHIPSKENKTLSPILKATLSRPPKPKNSVGVVERQQKKLEQEKGAQMESKLNGIELVGETEDSSASSSAFNSGEEADVSHRILPSIPPLTSFQGILKNGLGAEESDKDVEAAGEELIEGKNKLKGMLIDLLERKVNTRESPNGIGNREIRISDRGLELVDKLDDTNSNSSVSSGSMFVIKSSTCTSALDSCDAQQSQMTFYSASSESQVTLLEQAPSVQLKNPALKPCRGSFGGQNGGVVASSVSSIELNNGQAVNLDKGGGNDSGGDREMTNVAGAGSGGGSSGNVISSSSAVIHGNDTASTPSQEVDPSCATQPANATANTSSSLTASSLASNVLDGTDLLEKFNEISDLIVVPPEQLGIKRPRSASQGDDSSSGSEPPSKKPNLAINGNGHQAANANQESIATVSSTSLPPASTVFTSTSVLQSALSSPCVSATTAQTCVTVPTTVTAGAQIVISGGVQVTDATSQVRVVPASPVTTIGSTGAVSGSGGGQSSSTQVAPNQMMQLRLSVSPSNQLAFARQLVLPSGQQLILSATQSKNPLQGQVIISKPHVTSNDQMAKAIIILQPSQQQHQLQMQQTQAPLSTAQGQPSQNPVPTLLQHQLQQPPVLSPQQGTSGQGQLAAPLHIQPQTPQLQVQQVAVSCAVSTSQQPQQTTQFQVAGRSSSFSQSTATPEAHVQVQLSQSSPVISSQVQLEVPGSTQLQQSQGQQQSTPTVSQHKLAGQLLNSPQPVHIQNTLQNRSLQAGVASHVSPSSVVPISAGLSQQQQSSLNAIPAPTTDSEYPYCCEWAGCGQCFDRPGKVFLHVSKVHTPETLTEAVRCEWGQNGCDPLLRKRLSLMTHLQDRHCTKHALELSLYRRRNKIEPPPAPSHPAQHHLGYAPNAAFHAIKRHAMQFTNPKELLDDNEGPVTKSIRLTAALILKNIVQYSAAGRRILRGYEGQLATIAMSNVESSRTVAQLLYDMKEFPS